MSHSIFPRSIVKNLLTRSLPDSKHYVNNGKKRVIVFAPHQDDETLGCGGAIRQKIDAGQKVSVVFLADGSTSHARFLPGNELAEIRKEEAIEACGILGVSQEWIHFLEIPDGSLSEVRQSAVSNVENIIEEYRPEEIFVPFRFDVNPDHIATNQIVYKALTNTQHSCVIFEYPVWFWFHWPWISFSTLERHYYKLWAGNSLKTGLGFLGPRYFNTSLEITDVLEYKKKALSKHKTQMTKPNNQTEWPVLGEIAQGDFLDCFLGDREYYFRHEYKFNGKGRNL